MYSCVKHAERPMREGSKLVAKMYLPNWQTTDNYYQSNETFTRQIDYLQRKEKEKRKKNNTLKNISFFYAVE